MYYEALLKKQTTNKLLPLIEDFDFFYIFNICVNNSPLLERMSECLEYHYFNNLTRFKTRDALQLSLILNKLNNLLPKNNNNKALTYLFCVWIVIAFNDHNGVANLDKSDFIWFEKYAIVSKLFNILKKFIFKINYHFLQKNDVIILDEDVILKELV